MFPFSHFFTGYIVGGLLVTSGLVELSGLNIVLFGVMSLLPDIDALWHSEINQHHKTVFHAPLSWVILSCLLSFYSLELALIMLFTALVHIFTDYLTGRTIGIAFFYPFKGEEYSLYPVQKETASLNPVRPQKEMLQKHLSYYLENKNLVVLELFLNISGFFNMMLLILQL